MSLLDGRNAGITGLVDLPDAPGGSMKFRATVYAWKQAQTAAEIDAAGRSDDDWPEQVYLHSTGNLVCSGKVRLDGCPTPNAFNGQAGNITVTLSDDLARNETVPVRIISCAISRDQKQQDLWDITLSARITSNPTWNNWTGTATADTPTHTDKELWQGMGKSTDPQSISDGASQRYLLYNVTDTDAGEVAKISAMIAAATTPVTGLKLRPVAFARLSKRVCLLTMQWGRTDTKDDVVLPRTTTTIDASGLASRAQTAAVAVGTNVLSIPSPGGAFVLRDTSTNKLHDSAVLGVADYGLRTRQQDVEFDNSRQSVDPNALTTQAQITVVTTSPTPPATPTNCAGFTNSAELVYTHVSSIELVPGKWSHAFAYATRDSKQDVEMGGSHLRSDTNGLASESLITLVTNSAALPAVAPTSCAGFTNSTDLVFRAGSVRQLTSGKWVHAFEFGQQDTKQQIENEHTRSGSRILDAMFLRTAQVIDSTNSAYTDALALWNQYHSTITYDGSTVVKLNPNKSLYLIDSRDNHIVVETSARSIGAQPVGGYVDLTANPNVLYVYLAQKVYRGNGWWRCMVVPHPVYGVRMNLRIIRRAVTQSYSIGTNTGYYSDLVLHPELFNYTNDSPFLSQYLSAGTLQYVGEDQRTNISIPQPHVSETVHLCEYSSYGHWTTEGIVYDQWFDVQDAGDDKINNMVAGTWVLAGDFGWAAAPLPQKNNWGNYLLL